MKIEKPEIVRNIRSRVRSIIREIDIILDYALRNNKSSFKNKGLYGQKVVRDDLEMAKSYLQNIIVKKNNTPHINKMIPPKTIVTCPKCSKGE